MQDDDRLARDFKIAQALSKASGYVLKDGYFSVGGYKDWCITHLKIPSFTVEVENDDYDYKQPYNNLQKETSRNIALVDALMEELKQLIN